MLVTKIRNKIEMYVYSFLMNWEVNEWAVSVGHQDYGELFQSWGYRSMIS